MKPLRFMHSRRGSALVTGMIAALSVGVVSAIIMQQSQITEKQTRAPRVKSAMIQLETKVRELAFDSSSYETCPASSPSDCQVRLKPSVFAQIRDEVPGAVCDSAGFCGVELRNQAFDPGPATFSAEIVYTGKEVSLAPIQIRAAIPNFVWGPPADFGCDSGSPLFVGIDSSGNAVCRNLPNPCPPGEYVAAVDPMRLTTSSALTCRPLPAQVACDSDHFISSVRWNERNIASIAFDCTPKKSPFLVASLGSDPTAYNYSGDPSYPVSPYPTPHATPPPTPPPTYTASTLTSCRKSFRFGQPAAARRIIGLFEAGSDDPGAYSVTWSGIPVGDPAQPAINMAAPPWTNPTPNRLYVDAQCGGNSDFGYRARSTKISTGEVFVSDFLCMCTNLGL